MNGKEISVYGYLRKDEALELVSIFKRNSIEAFCHIMTHGEGDLDLHQVFISGSDVEKALPIIEAYRKVLELRIQDMKMVCSKCCSWPPVTEIKKKKGLLEKIYTMGTQIVICNKCGNKWYI